ncbi:citryl-CoA lyase [Candidatus Uhrbacteria bacterium]|nr:citryl-CoA lyase [Candidatus Uhrbacteria bacterium]
MRRHDVRIYSRLQRAMNEYHLHGKPISSLMTEMNLVSAIWFAWTGVLPSEAEGNILNACFVGCIDHGAEPPSARVTRVIASCGKPLADAVAAGILAFGPRHGNAASAASVLVREAVASGRSASDVARAAIEEKRRLPGFGHPEYEVDPRTTKLGEILKANLPSTKHFDFAQEISRELTAQKGKPLPLNIDGAIGAVLADLGASSDLADAIFLVARSVGLVMHAREEMGQSESYRRG